MQQVASACAHQLFQETDLINLTFAECGSEPPPATHQQGQGTTDVGTGSPLFEEALIMLCQSPFNVPVALEGNNRTLISDFCAQIPFGMSMKDMDAVSPCGTSSKN